MSIVITCAFNIFAFLLALSLALRARAIMVARSIGSELFQDVANKPLLFFSSPWHLVEEIKFFTEASKRSGSIAKLSLAFVICIYISCMSLMVFFVSIIIEAARGS